MRKSQRNMVTIIFILIVLQVLSSIGMGIIFENIKLNFKKGIIPIYNKIILIQKYKLPQYNLILVFIPIINLYTSYTIYKKICTTYNKDKLYALELTLFPFVYNIFLGTELRINNIEKPKPKKQEIEYTWQPKSQIKNQSIYKVSRNKNIGNTNITLYKESEIIQDTSIKKENKKNRKECPNCKSQIPEQAQICPVCGTKL